MLEELGDKTDVATFLDGMDKLFQESKTKTVSPFLIALKNRKMERLGLADGSFVGESEGAPVGAEDRAELFVRELDRAADLSNPPSEGLAWTYVTKAPRLFRLVWTSPLVAESDVEARELLKSLQIRLSPTVSVERQFDNKFVFFGLRGKQGKYFFSRTRAANLFQLVRTSPLVEGLSVEAKQHSKFLENPTFAEGFD